MLVTGFPAQAMGTNCYVLAPGRGEECLIIDPGIGVLDDLSQVLRELQLRPSAVLLTHGHFDHTYSVTPVCQASDIPALIHGDDRYRLDDPLKLMDPNLLRMLEQQFGEKAKWTEPSDIQLMSDREQINLAGLSVEVLHAPGHTEGSVMFKLTGVPDGVSGADVELTDTVITGDVLFAGSIGRTDLEGGDHQAMVTSLRDVVMPLPDGTLLLPGHGPASTMNRERQTNPYLLEVS